MELEGKTALIIGAGRGIGKVIATQFAKHGARVSLVSRSDHELEETASEVKRFRGNVLVIPGDISQLDQVQLIFDRTIQTFGPIHILINTAAVQQPIGPLWHNSPDLWAEAIRVNLIGSFYLCHEVIPGMIENREGILIFFSGGGAAYGRPNFSAYGVSKTGVLRMIETLSLELGGTGVLVYGVAPGAVKTRMAEEVVREAENAGGKAFKEALKVMEEGGVSPEKAAELCLFLATNRPQSLSGKLIHVNESYREYIKMAEINESGGLLRRIPFK